MKEGQDKKRLESSERSRIAPRRIDRASNDASNFDADSIERSRTELARITSFSPSNMDVNSPLACLHQMNTKVDETTNSANQKKSEAFETIHHSMKRPPTVSTSLRFESLDSDASASNYTNMESEADGVRIQTASSGEVAFSQSGSTNCNVSPKPTALKSIASEPDGGDIPLWDGKKSGRPNSEEENDRLLHRDIARTTNEWRTENYDRNEGQPDCNICLARDSFSQNKKQRTLRAKSQKVQHSGQNTGTSWQTFPAEWPSPNRRRKKKYKKPKDMPRRPLSAYNIFFREERARILPQLKQVGHSRQIARGKEAHDKHDDNASVPEREKHVAHKIDDLKSDKDLRTSEPPRDTSSDCGDITSEFNKTSQQKAVSGAQVPSLFSRMGRAIAERWNKLTPTQRDRYKKLAAVEKQRYHLEMASYNAKQIPKAASDEEEASQSSASERAVKRSSQADSSDHHQLMKCNITDVEKYSQALLTEGTSTQETIKSSTDVIPRELEVQKRLNSDSSLSRESDFLTINQKTDPAVAITSKRSNSSRPPRSHDEKAESCEILDGKKKGSGDEFDRRNWNSGSQQLSNHDATVDDFQRSFQTGMLIRRESSSRWSASPRDSILEESAVKSARSTSAGLLLTSHVNHFSQVPSSDILNNANNSRQQHESFSPSTTRDDSDRASMWPLYNSIPDSCEASAGSTVVDQLLSVFRRERQEQLAHQQAELLQQIQAIQNRDNGTRDYAMEEWKRSLRAALGFDSIEPTQSLLPSAPYQGEQWLEQHIGLMHPSNSLASNHLIESLLSSRGSLSDILNHIQGAGASNNVHCGQLDTNQTKDIYSLLLSLLRVKEAMEQSARQQSEAALRRDYASLLLNSSTTTSPALVLQLALAAVASLDGGAASSASMDLGLPSSDDHSSDNMTNQGRNSANNPNCSHGGNAST